MWEVEKSFNCLKLNNLKHAVDEGSKQASYIIIILSHDIDYEFLFRIVKGRFKDHKSLRTVEFRYDGNTLYLENKKAARQCLAAFGTVSR